MTISLSIIGIVGNEILAFMDIENRLVTGVVFFIMAISLVLEYHHAVHAQVYMGSNHVPFLLPALFSGFLILGIGFSVVGTFGLIGVVLTQFLVQLSINNWYPVYLDLKLLNWKFKDYAIDLISVPKIYTQRK